MIQEDVLLIQCDGTMQVLQESSTDGVFGYFDKTTTPESMLSCYVVMLRNGTMTMCMLL
jgi:hypothetical protein